MSTEKREDWAGQYYRVKAWTATNCLTAINALKELKILDQRYADKYQSMIDLLEKRLDSAHDVGD